MIRILQIVTSMNAGGIETFLMNVYRNIDRNKVQFDFLVHRKEKSFYDDEIAELGGKIFVVPRLQPHKLHLYRKKLKVFFQKNYEYMIIHSHINQNNYFPLSVAKSMQIPVRISHGHQYKSVRFHRKIIALYTKTMLKKTVTNRFACSYNAGVWLYGKKAYFKVIPNAIDTKKYIYDKEIASKKRIELGIADKFVIGHIGNFSVAKNYPFILKVFRVILDKNKNSILVLIGKNSSIPDIEKRVVRMGLEDSVLFTGVRSDIPELLQAMDVFLFPSKSEGLGIATIEAQASGLPCIISNDIPRETHVTNLVEVLSLDTSKNNWAATILKYAEGYDRIDTSGQIKSKGFDIAETAKWLEEFYIKEHEKLLPTNHY